MDDGVQFLIEPGSSTVSLSRSPERNKKETYSKRRPAYSMTNDRVSPAENIMQVPCQQHIRSMVEAAGSKSQAHCPHTDADYVYDMNHSAF